MSCARHLRRRSGSLAPQLDQLLDKGPLRQLAIAYHRQQQQQQSRVEFSAAAADASAPIKSRTLRVTLRHLALRPALEAVAVAVELPTNRHTLAIAQYITGIVITIMVKADELSRPAQIGSLRLAEPSTGVILSERY